MRKSLVAAGFIASAVLLSGCVQAAGESQTCRFTYNAKAEDAVISVLKVKFGETSKFFNYEKPTITQSGSRVEIALLPLKQIDGRTILYESIFVIVMDACSTRVVESYEAHY